MRGKVSICVVALAALVAATPAYAETPTREEYAAAVEPICERNAVANEQILKGARERVKSDKLKAASGQFLRASDAFGATIKELAAVPRPPADANRLQKWLGFLKLVKQHLGNIGKALGEGNKIKATHIQIRAERSGNAANNVVFSFPFKSCRLTPSRFR